jgi:hypothetical protein
MLHNAEQHTGDRRKLNLFGAACCRRYWPLLLPEAQGLLVEFEDLLDRGLTEEALREECHSLCGRANDLVRPSADRLRLAAAKAVCYAVLGCPWGPVGYFAEEDPAEVLRQAALLRDVFGNPFRPVSFDPSWRTDTVLSLAGGMYGSRDFSRVPILGDALQDAGCEDADVLGHCLDPKGVHVRGCWVVDRLLGKERRKAVPNEGERGASAP